MGRKITDIRMRLYLITAAVLIVGLGSSVFLYLTAENDTNDLQGYEVVGGTSYPVAPEDSKMYRHDLEVYGGKANVLADDFSRWFAGLWHGKSLASIVAFAAIIISIGFILAANRLHPEPDARGDGKGAGIG
jgi:hypothetical protein